VECKQFSPSRDNSLESFSPSLSACAMVYELDFSFIFLNLIDNELSFHICLIYALFTRCRSRARRREETKRIGVKEKQIQCLEATNNAFYTRRKSTLSITKYPVS
jgi:5'-3' exonuclease